MIDLDRKHLAEVLAILDQLASGWETWAFGSRIEGTAGRNSDLDLVLVGGKRLGAERLEALRDAFAESDLPFLVDILDWHDLSGEFRRILGARYEVLRSPLT